MKKSANVWSANNNIKILITNTLYYISGSILSHTHTHLILIKSYELDIYAQFT